MLTSTERLVNRIQNMKSLEDLEGKEYAEVDFPSYIKALMNEHHIKPRDLVVKLNMEKSYVYQILKGRRAPGRSFLIDFSFLAGLNLDDTQRLLEIAGRQPLYPRNKRDAAVIFAITHGMSYEKYGEFIEKLEGERSL